MSAACRAFRGVDQLELEFKSGMSVITGETGAGKSIVFAALGLILAGEVQVVTSPAPGQLLDLKILRAGAYYGEVGFLTQRPATATLRANTEGSVLVFPCEALNSVIGHWANPVIRSCKRPW